METRLIPVLQLDSRRRVVKTRQFGDRVYIGDPFNVMRILNEKEVDEVVVLDIDATREGREPDIGFIRELASECFMPMAYGGGLTTLRQCETLNADGIEKFVVGAKALDSSFIAELAAVFGVQAVMACIDVRGDGPTTRCVVRSGAEPVDIPLETYALRLQAAGVGEIMIQSVDRDGMRDGYDLALIRALTAVLAVPLVAMGGAGSLEHLRDALAAGASAAASGSAFCFIGRLRAVLVSYPTPSEMTAMLAGTGGSQ